MLVDKPYRAAIVRAIRDPKVRFFWHSEFSNWNERFLSEIISPVQNKVGAIVSAPSLRNILGQWRSSFDIASVMRERKILLLNLSKGQIGEDKANLIGSLVVATLQAAAMKRAAELEGERSDYHLYVDEFHSFGTDVFSSILSEARKFRLTLTLSQQYLAQSPDNNIRDSILGNVGNLICFRVGADDARHMSRELADYSPDMLRNLGRGEVCVRLLQCGETLQPFMGTTWPPSERGFGRTKTIREQCRQRYSKNRKQVEAQIAQWLDSIAKDSA